MSDYSENEACARLIAASEPWLGEIVIIGGWAHRRYRLHPSAQTLDYTPLSTFDADIAIPPEFRGGTKISGSGCSPLIFPRSLSGTISRRSHLTNCQNTGQASLPNF
ncbi:MAG: hypothetical protein ACRD2B_04845 [Terriglobia bacterium]